MATPTPPLSRELKSFLRQAQMTSATPEIRAAVADIVALWTADPVCIREEDRAQVMPAAEELAIICGLDVLNDPAQPEFLWSLVPPFSIEGEHYPGSRFGVDNPDNTYRFARIDESSSYRITGRFPGKMPIDFSITALPFPFADGKMGATSSFIGKDDIDFAEDGSFEIVVTPQGGKGRIASQGAVQLVARETFGDWVTAEPALLSITRSGGPDLSARGTTELTIEVARLLRARGAFLPAGLQRAIYQRCAVNELVPPAKAGPLGGLVTQVTSLGHFDLDEDEALILSVDDQGASYVGFQIADPWTVSYPYIEHFGSLSDSQAQRDSEGRITLVISRLDPGFINWIEPYGGRSGSITCRWQQIPENAAFGPDALRVRKVPFDNIRNVLEGKAAFVTPQERAEHRRARAQQWYRRATGNRE